MKCRKCIKQIEEPRIKLGYDTCKKCSDTKKYGVVGINVHKTGNSCQIIKDPDIAASINEASRRTGFGVSRGVKGNTKKTKPVSNKRKVVISHPSENFSVKRRAPDPSKYDYIYCLKKIEQIYNRCGINHALHMIDVLFQMQKCGPKRRKQLREIVLYLEKTTRV